MSAASFSLARTRSARSGLSLSVDPSVLRNPSADSRFFDVTPTPFPGYPAPGAASAVVLALMVPPGHGCVLRWLAIVAIGGGYVDGSGNAIWRMLVNGSAVQGYEGLTCQVGTLAQPSDTQIVADEGDTIEVTVEVPAAQPPMPAGATTSARAKGWFFPKLRGGQ